MDESWLGIIYGGNKKLIFLKTRLVSEFAGTPYIINDAVIAADGSTRNVPRWLLFPVKPNENKRFGKTLGTDRGIVEKVLEKVSDNRVKVRFRMPYPQMESKLERFYNQ